MERGHTAESIEISLLYVSMERHRELLINNIIISPNISLHDSMILFRSFRFGLNHDARVSKSSSRRKDRAR